MSYASFHHNEKLTCINCKNLGIMQLILAGYHKFETNRRVPLLLRHNKLLTYLPYYLWSFQCSRGETYIFIRDIVKAGAAATRKLHWHKRCYWKVRNRFCHFVMQIRRIYWYFGNFTPLNIPIFTLFHFSQKMTVSRKNYWHTYCRIESSLHTQNVIKHKSFTI